MKNLKVVDLQNQKKLKNISYIINFLTKLKLSFDFNFL